MFRLLVLTFVIVRTSGGGAGGDDFTAAVPWEPFRVLGFFPYNGYSHYVMFQVGEPNALSAGNKIPDARL